MNWAEIMKATASATSADRSATADRVPIDLPWNWNPHEVWLTRARGNKVSGLQYLQYSQYLQTWDRRGRDAG